MSRRFFALWVFRTLLFPAPALTQASGEKWSSLPMTLDLVSPQGRYIPLQNGRVMISFEPQERPMLDLAGSWRKLRLTPTTTTTTMAMTTRTKLTTMTPAMRSVDADVCKETNFGSFGFRMRYDGQ